MGVRMNRFLDQYLDPSFVYKYTHGPDVVRSRYDALRRGINCVSLAHLALNDLFDYQLPNELDCYELYTDSEHFESVADLECMRIGDLVWFGREATNIDPENFIPIYQDRQLLNWEDFPIRHVAIYTGEYDEDYLLLHSTHLEGTNAVWPLSRFASYAAYRKLYGISRLKNAA